MRYFKLRIDTMDTKAVIALVEKYSPDYYIVGEEKTGTLQMHCHAYLETNSKPGAIRIQIRRKFGSGNGIYSFVELDEKRPIEYLAYCLKDKKYFLHGVSPEELEKYKIYDKNIKDEIRRKKNNRTTIQQKIIIYIEESKIKIEDSRDILGIVIDYYKKHELIIREFQLVSLVQTLSLKYIESYEYTLFSKILEKL